MREREQERKYHEIMRSINDLEMPTLLEILTVGKKYIKDFLICITKIRNLSSRNLAPQRMVIKNNYL